MAYIPTNFNTTAVINADTLFQNYDNEVQVLMSDVGDYLTTEMTKVYEETETIVTDGITVNSVETIEDLATQDGVVFKTIIVKDLNRGGTFIWSATGTANGGTVFAGVSGYWNRQYSGAVNVKWFGAVGDGVTDDTVAIQSALDTGISIIVPDGNYKITSTINLVNSNITIRGNGRIFCDDNIGVMFNISNVYNLRISDITLECTFIENTTIAIYSVSGVYLANSSIDGVIIRGVQIGISIEGKNNSFNDENYKVGIYSTNLGYKDLINERDAKNSIINCTIENSLSSSPAGTGGSPAIYLRGSFFNCSNNKIRNMYGPAILGGTDSIIHGNIIINMIRENGIYLSGVKRCTVSNNHIENVLTDCIALNASKSCSIIGNTLISNGNSLVRIQDNTENCTISGNVMEIPSSITTLVMRGFQNININGCANILFSNNAINLNGLARSTPIIAIAEVSGTVTNDHTNISFANNIFNSVNCSTPMTAYYENKVILIKSGFKTMAMSGNKFFNFTGYSTGNILGGKNYFHTITATEKNNNTIVYTDLVTHKTPNKEYIRVNIGAAGAITSLANTSSLISNFEKGVNTGEYIVTFKQPISLIGIDFSSSGSNKVDGISYNITQAATSDDTISSIIITLFNLSIDAVEVPVYPHYNCTIMLNFNAISYL